jgi:hypothetical protein
VQIIIISSSSSSKGRYRCCRTSRLWRAKTGAAQPASLSNAGQLTPGDAARSKRVGAAPAAVYVGKLSQLSLRR